MRSERVVYCVVSGLLALILSFRAVTYLPYFDHTTFHGASLWLDFFVVLSFHVILFLLAYFYELFYGTLSILFFYIFFLLSLYFLSLINALGIHAQERLWLGTCVIGFFIPLVSQIRKKWAFKIRPPQFSWEDGLIFLWGINAVFLFSRLNFTLQRAIYMDEGSFWFVAARDMLTHSLQWVHTASYAGAGLHPLGVPFLAALPVKFFGLPDPRAIFFFPVSIILCLLIFLYRIKSQSWTFIFFLCALSGVFYNRSWLAYFLYGFVYGEGISAMIFLVMTYEWLRLLQNKLLSDAVTLIFCLGIGLMALTKSPLASIVIPFSILFLCSVFYARKAVNPRASFKFLVFALLLAFCPMILWRMTVMIWHVPFIKVAFSFNELLGRCLHPHLWMFKNMLGLMWENSNNLFYYGFMAILSYLCFSRKILYGFPAVILFTGVFLYYAYFYNYGTDTGDFGSALRYFMPVWLVFFYLGGLGFENIMRRIEQGQWKVGIKIAVQSILCLFLVWGLFEIKTAEKILTATHMCGIKAL
ncbi:MAG: hypothetical protein HQL16_02800 [Candidatus Omnitrophica bacterium]|nr:hypothetical protein [Candidatus Omnitrophota bacterium]